VQEDFVFLTPFQAPFSESLEILIGDKSGTFVEPHQILNRVLSVAGDGEDASPRFVRKTVVEDADRGVWRSWIRR
jgi:hypothetical protein